MALSFGNTATTPSTPPFFERVISADPDSIRQYPTVAGVQYNVGDILVLNSGANSGAGAVVPVSTVAWDSNLQTTQTDALTVFVGICAARKNPLDLSTASIAVYTKGTARFTCSALGSASAVGAGVAPAGQGTNNLSDFTMAIATSQASTFGTLTQAAAAGATSLTFFFQSALLYGQLQAA
jgi:hypothetical protein